MSVAFNCEFGNPTIPNSNSTFNCGKIRGKDFFDSDLDDDVVDVELVVELQMLGVEDRESVFESAHAVRTFLRRSRRAFSTILPEIGSPVPRELTHLIGPVQQQNSKISI